MNWSAAVLIAFPLLGCGGAVSGASDAGVQGAGASSGSSGSASGGSGSSSGVNECPSGEAMCNGACKAGQCLVALAADQAGAAGIAVDTANVYWTTSDGVEEVPIGGGTAITLASGQSNAWAIVTDGTSVYWTNRGTQEKNFADGSVMGLSIGEASPVILAAQQTNPKAIAVDASNVYWVSGQTLMKTRVGGGSATVLASPNAAIGGIAVSGGNVYFTVGPSADSTSVPPPAGGVMTVPIGGGPTSTLVSAASLAIGPVTTVALAVVANTVYWSAQLSDGVNVVSSYLYAVQVGGGTPVRSWSAKNGEFLAVAVDDAAIYWTLTYGAEQGEVGSCGLLAACQMNPSLVAGQGLPQSSVALAVDATSVYWIADSTIHKLTPK